MLGGVSVAGLLVSCRCLTMFEPEHTCAIDSHGHDRFLAHPKRLLEAEVTKTYEYDPFCVDTVFRACAQQSSST